VRFVRDEMGVEIGLLGLTRMNMVFLSIITSVRKLQVDAGARSGSLGKADLDAQASRKE
jgi:hypothetical protein